jgi:hypothetical protein
VKGRKGDEGRWRVIRASEFAQYNYCARAWWLGSIMGYTPTNTRDLERGNAAHARHGRQVWLASALRIAAIALATAAVIALILAFTLR